MRLLELNSGDQLWFDMNQYLRRIYDFNQSFVNFLMVSREENRVIGMCGFHTVVKSHNRGEIGYEIYREEHKRKGYMSEALPEILRYGFEVMELHRIEALIGPNNTASLALVNRIGFVREGYLREHYLRKGIYEDSVMFSLLRNEFGRRALDKE